MLRSLRARFRPPPGDERLLRLFRSRAGRKRDYAWLQGERDRVVEHLRQQDSQALRLQQRLDQLGGLLADPRRAANVVVCFQWRDARVERDGRVRARKAAARRGPGAGLGIDGRRAVEVAVIALAQELCLPVAAHAIVDLARDTVTLAVADAGYGGPWGSGGRRPTAAMPTRSRCPGAWPAFRA